MAHSLRTAVAFLVCVLAFGCMSHAQVTGNFTQAELQKACNISTVAQADLSGVLKACGGTAGFSGNNTACKQCACAGEQALDVIAKPIYTARDVTLEDLPPACIDALAGYTIQAANVSIARADAFYNNCTYNKGKTHIEALAAC